MNRRQFLGLTFLYLTHLGLPKSSYSMGWLQQRNQHEAPQDFQSIIHQHFKLTPKQLIKNWGKSNFYESILSIITCDLDEKGSKKRIISLQTKENGLEIYNYDYENEHIVAVSHDKHLNGYPQHIKRVSYDIHSRVAQIESYYLGVGQESININGVDKSWNRFKFDYQQNMVTAKADTRSHNVEFVCNKRNKILIRYKYFWKEVCLNDDSKIIKYTEYDMTTGKKVLIQQNVLAYSDNGTEQKVYKSIDENEPQLSAIMHHNKDQFLIDQTVIESDRPVIKRSWVRSLEGNTIHYLEQKLQSNGSLRNSKKIIIYYDGQIPKYVSILSKEGFDITYKFRLENSILKLKEKPYQTQPIAI